MGYGFQKRWIKIKQWYNNVVERKFSKVETLNIQQEKAVIIFKEYLKNKNSRIYCSISSGKRQIEYDDVFIMFNKHNDMSYVMTIIDSTNETINGYEISIPSKSAYKLIDKFDIEMERRLRGLEFDKRQVINDDMDKLIKLAIDDNAIR